MTDDDIAQKLALLPDGLEEKNIKSWESVLRFYEMASSSPSNSWLTPMVDMIQTVIDSGQHRLDHGDHHIRVEIDDKNSIEVWYGIDLYDSERLTFDGNKIVVELQPFLDKLWNETRGKKNV